MHGNGIFIYLYVLFEEKMGKVTIKDVARASGVSKGTVDRVLHGRDGVSRKSREKILKVIEELGYEPNVYASLLASRKVRSIAVILPEHAPGEFWELYEAGIEKAVRAVAPLNIEIARESYNQYEIESFRAACRRALKNNPAGVVVAPLFKAGTSLFTAELREKDIPYVFVDTKIEEDGYLSSYGMPMYRSGYLCADILSFCKPCSEILVVRIERDKHRQSDPTVGRREGFRDFIAENSPECTVHNVFIDPKDPEGVAVRLGEFFKEHPGVRHIATFNSRIHLIVPFLEKSGIEDLAVVGFDNLPANIEALRKGIVRVLITQHPEEQAARAIQDLADFIVFKKSPAKRDNFVHMDILTRYNTD